MLKKFRINVNGRSYEVTAELLPDTPSSSPLVVSSAAVEARPTPAKKPVVAAPAGSGDVLSPLAGKVVSLDAKVGDKVSQGQKVLTLEAMKMNTFVIAPREGTLTEIKVSPGQAVAEGELLAIIS
jgi:glutaconyl-CoA/methylmalonyl-CoA decarboxylase subunit gamma